MTNRRIEPPDQLGAYAMELHAELARAVSVNHARHEAEARARQAAEDRWQETQSGTRLHDKAWAAVRKEIESLDTQGNAYRPSGRGRR